ncbi:hypothetical protein ZWY2020_044293 [Hordeum vulgare]|nr:hypothetical protein ZWY2020_044293 [Hordeum vulgare]
MEGMWRKAKRAIGNGICAHLLAITADRDDCASERRASDAFSQDSVAAQDASNTWRLRQPALLSEVHVGSKVLEVNKHYSSSTVTVTTYYCSYYCLQVKRFPAGRRAVVHGGAGAVGQAELDGETTSRQVGCRVDLDQLTALFATNGLSHTDMIALSGTYV